MPSAQQMHMQMRYRLPAIRACIHHQPIPVLQTLRPRQLPCNRHQMPHKGGVLCYRMRVRFKMPLRYHQQVHGRLRVDVRKRKALFILKHPVSRNRSRDDLAEQTICHHTQILPAPYFLKYRGSFPAAQGS